MQISLSLQHASENWPRFLDICNRCLTYAPYTVPFNQGHADRIFAPFLAANQTLCLIGSREKNGKLEEGVVHISLLDGDDKFAILHLLLADSNDVAQSLLQEAQNWASSRAGLIRSHNLRLNPYSCLMHGTESYCWGGLYATRNAFARQGWDLELDIINMYLDMPTCPDIIDSGLKIIEVDNSEDELSINGKFRVIRGEEVLASCGYTYHKAISAHFGKGIGQLWIYAQAESHGQGYGLHVITAAHNRLYKLGASRVILATNNGLFRAVKFYEKLGYKPELIHAFTFQKEL